MFNESEETFVKKLFLGVYNPSIILTYIGVFCSIYGMVGLLTSRDMIITRTLNIAMIMLVVAGVCDMFDGTIARMCKRTEKEKAFGIQLDSLADTVSFVVFPATMLVFMTGYNIASVIIACFYVFAGIMRLGWFNVTTEENKGFYMGLPVTFAALIFPALYLILRFIDCGFETIIVQIVFSIVALLFILNFKVKKVKVSFLILMLILSVVVIAGLILLI
jgi:CDP-diacylglycerol--serine O-phosphatidyltransferase